MPGRRARSLPSVGWPHARQARAVAAAGDSPPLRPAGHPGRLFLPGGHGRPWEAWLCSPASPQVLGRLLVLSSASCWCASPTAALPGRPAGRLLLLPPPAGQAQGSPSQPRLWDRGLHPSGLPVPPLAAPGPPGRGGGRAARPLTRASGSAAGSTPPPRSHRNAGSERTGTGEEGLGPGGKHGRQPPPPTRKFTPKLTP